jgi:uncharacterized membrane protein (DUF2068 family)
VAKPPLTAGYLAIIAFKYAKLAAFLILGLTALRMARLPADSLAHDLVRLFGAHQNAALVQHAAAALSVLTPREILALGSASILLGLTFGTEGTLLACRVWWAPYLTVVITALGLPYEIYEISRAPRSLHRWLLLAANAAILVYLWGRKDDFRREAPPGARPSTERPESAS